MDKNDHKPKEEMHADSENKTPPRGEADGGSGVNYIAAGVSVGLALGLAFGEILFGSMTTGMVIGMCLGLAIGASIKRKPKK
jgi:F0F1-type ATP synthase assembly protein I